MREKRILVLEDEVVVGIDMVELFNEHGYSAKHANTPDEGLKLVRTFRPQLAICDINLGKSINGIEFVKLAKEINDQLEIIYVTAYSTQSIIDSAAETHFNNFIIKPWNDQQLLVTVQIAFNFILQKNSSESVLSELSLAEYRVLELVAKQMTSKDIAKTLFISEKTVRNHRYNISKKLNLPGDKNSLLKWAIANIC